MSAWASHIGWYDSIRMADMWRSRVAAWSWAKCQQNLAEVYSVGQGWKERSAPTTNLHIKLQQDSLDIQLSYTFFIRNQSQSCLAVSELCTKGRVLGKEKNRTCHEIESRRPVKQHIADTCQ